MNKTALTILAIIILMAVSFFVGRSTIEIQTDIKYIKGHTIRDTVEIPVPYEVKVPGETKYVTVYKRDSIGRETTEVDTLKSKDATIEDWNLERKYANAVFDNENGKFSYDLSVQNNRLSSFRYTYTPVHRQLPPKEKVWQPYVSASYSTLNIIGVGGGIFYHNLGFEYQYQRDLQYNDVGHSFGIKYKF